MEKSDTGEVMLTSLSVSYCHEKQHGEKKFMEERVYSTCTSIPSFIQEESQGRNLDAGADAEARKWWCLLACFPWLAQFALL